MGKEVPDFEPSNGKPYHRYEVELHNGEKKIVDSEKHHSQFVTVAAWVSFLSALLALPDRAVKAYKYLRIILK